MQEVDKILLARWVIPLQSQNEYLEHTAVVINNGKIIDIVPNDQINTKYLSNNVLSLDQHALLPGFINSHTHSPMNLFRGIADDLPLMQWLTNHIWPAEQNTITPDTVTLGSQLAIAEMIRGGTTCFNDHYFFPESTEQVAIQTGIRACLGLQVFNVKTLWSNNEAEAIAKAKDILHRRFNTHPNITWSIAPQGPYSVDNNALKQIKLISEQYEIPVHIHMHETQAEIHKSLQDYGCRPLERFHNLGLINDKLLAVHMVHINAEEIRTITDKNVNIVHSPESNLKLGSGIAPIYQLQQAGANIALGTDGAASNNDLDMIGEMRTASLLAKGITNNAAALNSYDILKMATINGARALGIDTITGSLESGKQADIIAIDLSDVWQQPILNPVSHIVYSGNRLSVSDCWVNGKQLLKNKQLTTINASELLTKLKKVTTRIEPFRRKT
jgi:5-methylthioadenosine/S-adenosylhomocysteine deaminase